MHSILVAMLWAVALAVLLTGIAFLALKWLALRLARQVAEATERRVASAVHDGLSRAGLQIPGVASVEQRARYLAQIDRLAWLMDRVIPLPVVGGVGLDAVLGLVPVAGDVASFCISAIIVIRAAQLGVPRELISRLIAIQCTDMVLGTVPILGDLVDVAYQADIKCAVLIRGFLRSKDSV